MRWGAGLVLAVCAVCVVGAGCSDDKPKPFEGVLLDPLGDIVPSTRPTAGAQPPGIDVEAVTFKADGDRLRIRVVWSDDAELDLEKHRVALKLSTDGDDDADAVVGAVAMEALACDRPDDFCSTEVEGGQVTWTAREVVLDLPRSAVPKVDAKTRWSVDRWFQATPHPEGAWRDVIDMAVPAAAAAVFRGEDLAGSGADWAAVSVAPGGRPRLLIDDVPAGEAAVRFYARGKAEPAATFGLSPFRQGEDVDMELGAPGAPLKPPADWEVEIETGNGTTRRVAPLRP